MLEEKVGLRAKQFAVEMVYKKFLLIDSPTFLFFPNPGSLSNLCSPSNLPSAFIIGPIFLISFVNTSFSPFVVHFQVS